jgi:hypothetical protein
MQITTAPASDRVPPFRIGVRGRSLLGVDRRSERDELPYARNKQEEFEVKVPAFHTNSSEYPPSHRNVHHDYSECRYGKDILLEDRVAGTGNKPLWDECIKHAS